MPINLSETLFDGETVAEVLRLGAKRHLIRDLDYYYQTADMIFDGYDPETRKPLTMSRLKAWVARCEHPKEPQDNDPTHHTAMSDGQNRPVHNQQTTVHPRHSRALLQHRERSPN